MVDASRSSAGNGVRSTARVGLVGSSMVCEVDGSMLMVIAALLCAEWPIVGGAFSMYMGEPQSNEAGRMGPFSAPSSILTTPAGLPSTTVPVLRIPRRPSLALRWRRKAMRKAPTATNKRKPTATPAKTRTIAMDTPLLPTVVCSCPVEMGIVTSDEMAKGCDGEGGEVGDESDVVGCGGGEAGGTRYASCMWTDRMLTPSTAEAVDTSCPPGVPRAFSRLLTSVKLRGVTVAPPSEPLKGGSRMVASTVMEPGMTTTTM